MLVLTSWRARPLHPLDGEESSGNVLSPARRRERRCLSGGSPSSRSAVESRAAFQWRDCGPFGSSPLQSFLVAPTVTELWVGGFAGRTSLGQAARTDPSPVKPTR